MTRILTISLIAVACGCFLARHHVDAQSPPKKSASNDTTRHGVEFILEQNRDDTQQNQFSLQALDAAKQQHRELQQRLVDYLTDLQRQSSEKSSAAQPGSNQSLRNTIRRLLEENFDARQRLQRAELEQLRQQLRDIENALVRRENNKDVIVNSRVDALLNAVAEANRKGEWSAEVDPDGKIITVQKWSLGPSNVPRRDPATDAGNAPPPAGTPDYPPAGFKHEPRNAPSPPPQEERSPDETGDDASAAAFDIDTRERLAQLDLKAAEEEYVAAEKALKHAQKLRDAGTVTESALSSREQEHRRAAVAVERAKIKLDGIARQRTELKRAAETAIAEANFDVEKTAATVRASQANVAAADARVAQLKASVVEAEATFKFREKQYARMKALAAAKSIDERLLDEAEENRQSAQAALTGAKAAVAMGQVSVKQAEALLERAQAESGLAEQRLKAARAALERVGHDDQGASR